MNMNDVIYILVFLSWRLGGSAGVKSVIFSNIKALWTLVSLLQPKLTMFLCLWTNYENSPQYESESVCTNLGWAPLVRLGVVSGVSAGPKRAVARVGEAAAYRAVTGRGVCRGEQASALQPCCHHTTSAHVSITSLPIIIITNMNVHQSAPDNMTQGFKELKVVLTSKAAS